jgi:hypothetical protein
MCENFFPKGSAEEPHEKRKGMAKILEKVMDRDKPMFLFN